MRLLDRLRAIGRKPTGPDDSLLADLCAALTPDRVRFDSAERSSFDDDHGPFGHAGWLC